MAPVSRHPASVAAVNVSNTHTFSKSECHSLELLVGLGVKGDAHCGATVKHRSRVQADPTQPNLRQVHLLQLELIESLQTQGFRVAPGVMGENITTQGIDLLSLPLGTQLQFADRALITITGLRNPCAQLNNYQKGLTQAVLERGLDGELIRKAGVMGVVSIAGNVCVGDAITMNLPPLPHCALERV